MGTVRHPTYRVGHFEGIVFRASGRTATASGWNDETFRIASSAKSGKGKEVLGHEVTEVVQFKQRTDDRVKGHRRPLVERLRPYRPDPMGETEEWLGGRD
jgi:hypothetical protein